MTARLAWPDFAVLMAVTAVVAIALPLLWPLELPRPQPTVTLVERRPAIVGVVSLPGEPAPKAPTPVVVLLSELPTPAAPVRAASGGITPITRPDRRAAAIRAEFSGLPLADAAEAIVQSADRWGVSWSLLAALGFVESTAGKYPCAQGNAWGWACPQGFASWAAGADAVAAGIAGRVELLGLRRMLCQYKAGGECDGLPATERYIADVLDAIGRLEGRTR